MTDQEKIQAIDTLVKALAYTQEVTHMGKQDPSDLASPLIPQYVYKKQMLEGKTRLNIESALNSLVVSIVV